jgi:23S rRNA (adenine2503-C2)-methyltransferase
MTAKSPSSLHPEARLPEEWQAVALGMGEAPFRGKQVFRWLHARGIRDPQAMTDLPKAFRERLPSAEFTAPLEVAEVKRTRDGTRKLVCKLARGGTVECVLIPMNDDPEEPGEDAEDGEEGWDGRVTLCISTQIGCAMGCVFCASGQAGLERGLEPEEVVAQVAAARLHLDANEHLRNLVFMGMGEPLHHYDDTVRAIRLITHPDGLAISPRRITVSTVGLVPGIRKLGEDFAGKVGLALSLHAPNDVVRGRIMPMNKKYPFGEVLEALRQYPLPKRRRITIEYTLIDGVNDDVAHARELAGALRGLRVKVNLIPMNPIEASELRSPRAARVEAFRAALSGEGYGVSVRKTRGDDVDAACGQLVLKDRLREKAQQKRKGNEPCSDGSS